eukprot:gene12092-15199_t
MCIASEPPQAVQSSTAGHADAGGEGGTDPSQAGGIRGQVSILSVISSSGRVGSGDKHWGYSVGPLHEWLCADELLLVGPLPAAARRLLSSYAAFSAGCRVEEAGLLEEETLAPNPSQAGEALAVKKGKTGAGSTAGNTNPAVKEKLTSFFSANNQLLHLEKPGVGVEAELGFPQSIQSALAAAIDHLSMFGQENVLIVVSRQYPTPIPTPIPRTSRQIQHHTCYPHNIQLCPSPAPVSSPSSVANDQLLHLEKPGVGVEAVLGLPQSIQTALAAAIDHLTMFGQENVLRVVCPETSAGSSGASWRMLSSQQEMSLSANAIRQLEIMCTSASGDTEAVSCSLCPFLIGAARPLGVRLLQERWVVKGPSLISSLISND